MHCWRVPSNSPCLLCEFLHTGAISLRLALPSAGYQLFECYKDLILNDTARRCCAESLISGTLTAIFGARGTPEAVAIKLNCLTGLFSEIVNNNRLDRHLHNVGRMRAIQLGTKQLRKIVQSLHSFSWDRTISSPRVLGAGR